MAAWFPRATLLFTLLTVLAASAAQATTWQAQDLGRLGGFNSVVTSINNDGSMVGYFNRANTNPGDTVARTFVWTATSGFVDLSPLLGTTDGVVNITIGDGGWIAGTRNGGVPRADPRQMGVSRGFVIDPDRQSLRFTDGFNPGRLNTLSVVNASGTAAGNSQGALSSPSPGYTFDTAGTVLSLGSVLGGTFLDPTSINNLGQVVGVIAPSGSSFSGGFITGPNGTDIQSIGSFSNGITRPRAINDQGQAVGFGWRSQFGDATAFLTGPGINGLLDVGALNGLQLGSEANDINNAGWIVGEFGTAAGARAFVTTGPNGQGLVDLNMLVNIGSADVLVSAWAINDRQEILATSALGRQYLISPVPEPHTLALMLGGLALLAGAARRRSS